MQITSEQELLQTTYLPELWANILIGNSSSRRK